jgi:acyl carrier protein
MTRAEFLRQLETYLEVKPGSLQGPEELATFPGWDSMALMSLIALADRSDGVRLSVHQCAECRTVQELVDVFAKNPSPP